MEEEITQQDTDAESAIPVEWIQVSGHPGIFFPMNDGRVWKKCMNNSRNEPRIYRKLTADTSVASLVPRYYGERETQDDYYVEIENVLKHFVNPTIMDVKMGVRTYLESEMTNGKKWKDLYEKMIAIDFKAPTVAEHEEKAITKVRYMQFRENLSSSSTLGFRIDAVKFPEDEKSRKNFSRIKTTQQVSEKLKEFLRAREDTRRQLLERLRHIRNALQTSSFFKTHEFIGSSLLVVYDQRQTGVWMIDFHNTKPTKNGRILTHLHEWQIGNNEDGYLFGLNNLIQILSNVEM